MDLRKVPLLSLLTLALCAQGAFALATGRHGHTSTLLPDGNFLFLGGTTGSANAGTASGEIYFTSAAAFGASASIPAAKSSHTTTLMGDGRLLVAGGFVNGAPTAASYVYSTLAGTWDGPYNLGTARGGHTATLINKGTNSGKVLVCGGQTGGATAITDTCEIFTPGTNSFAPVQSMSSQRLGHTASAIAGGRVFVSGGRRWDAANSTFTYLSTNEIYDPENDQWQTVTALTTGRAGHSAVVLNNGTILISGGYNGTNRLDSPEESWYRTAEGIEANHTPGNWGYLDSAEIFDSYGGRVPVSGSDYAVMPYRNSRHAAALTGDGQQHMYGGYGNIPPTYFTPSIELEGGSTLVLNKTDITTATINAGSSALTFWLETELTRPVSGRLVNADIFFSKPPERDDPTITVENASIHVNYSTVAVDGSPVGAYGQPIDPGEFRDLLTMQAPRGPGGKVFFAPQDVVSDGDTAAAGSSLAFAGPLAAESPPTQLTAGSQLVMPIVFNVPSVYFGGVISGTVTLTAGAIIDGNGFWSVTLTSGTGSFTSNPVYINPITGQGVAECPSVTFPRIEGTILNTTVTALGSPVSASGDEVSSLSMRAQYTSTRIDVSGLKYSADISTIIVREMIFADDVVYTPADSSWDFGPVAGPLFDHSAIITPAADVLLGGGRNCEPDPYTDCQRGVKTFTASNYHAAYISYNLDEWPASGNLKTKRAFHTSTLLPDGRILTCGGSDGTATLDSCELYDPDSRTWEEAAPMTTPRSKHTATLLPSGRVLAAGGALSPSTHTTVLAEIYYPDTDRWVRVSSMSFSRANHTALLMPDGNVLVAGGNTLNGYASSAELFITTNSAWQTVGGMTTARSQHTATLLKNGNVLVTGGINGAGALISVDLYNSAARTWSNPGWNMKAARYSHAANLLLDGRVMVTGGTNGTNVLDQAEILAGGVWRVTDDGATIDGNKMLIPRANHRSTLLPNGKLMITGGERPGESHSVAEGYDVDFSTFQAQGKTSKRANHTAVLLNNNRLVVIGGWDGSKYLDSVSDVYFSYDPDGEGFESAVSRNPVISTATSLLTRGDRLTVRSADNNLHGASEASGGGSGSMNSSFHNPRVYLQQMDNPSGFLIDATTRLYTLYGGPNTNWEKTVSSITIVTPANSWELPYGWYKARVAANGQFSEGVTVQVADPRPTGTPGIPTGSVMGTSSITWTWSSGGVSAADGYMIYSSSDGVFISTAAFLPSASYTQTGLQPNTPISIMVGSYNMGGGGPLSQSATYYTLAAVPASLRVTSASFTTAELSWSANNNSPVTPFELSICPDSDFANPLLISTPIPFSSDYTETSARITSLSANRMYYFRLRAKNGAGINTAFTSSISTITVGAVNNFTGTAVSTYSINWSWSSSTGADFYELFDLEDEELPVYVGSTTATEFTQAGLLPDRPYTLAARAMKLNPGFGPVSGPLCTDDTVHTLSVAPAAHPSDPFIDVTTGSFTMNWIGNGNAAWTIYEVTISTDPGFLAAASSSFSVTGETMSFGGLSANYRYYARIASINGDARRSSYLNLGPKYTLARPPANVTPADISMSGVTVNWDTNDNSEDTVYELRGTTSSFTGTYTTYIPFSQLFTENSYTLNGLLTSTTYYFDVAARNGEGLLSSRVQAVPPAYTVPGPGGAPSGSIGGVAASDDETVIAGTLPNMRQVSLTVPAGAFTAPTSIAISSSITGACGGYTVCGRTMEVAIYSENGAQPQIPVTLELAYECTIPDTSKLVVARYNPVSGQCLPLETKIDPGTRKVTATLNHFSVFQLMVRNASAALNDVLIYPNPFKTNRGNGFVTMANMPASAKVRIYTLSGVKVWEGTAGTTGILIWRGVNKSGQQVASGIYLAVVDSSSGKKTFKLAVER